MRWKIMRSAAALGLVVLQSFVNSFSGSLSPIDTSINGIELGDSSKKVLNEFGAPETIWIAKDYLEAAAQNHDMHFIYPGVAFYFEDGVLEWFELFSDGYSIESGLEVGSTYSDEDFFRIEGSDCGVQVYISDEVVERIKVFCFY
ncbi:hypothetical protein BGP77_17265 [Saccharospirillum sp. MSK14-1]|uniref:hypothetical protein n=1 Tax=Saccharospirillum sp. MSK14-1 TaxID=1897632 RepID=UPI000D331DF1|nr:hypothetical protein [Saccharospirillum sp. MSK14-1]PTY38195.1 hypothetical protein BGP77_17265 [Saccharospirillum sp. MSK14-1]